MTAPDNMFPDRMCIDVGYCEKWVDPEELAERQREAEAVFW